MNKTLTLLALATFLMSSSCSAEKIQLTPYDCGPLGRGELGVVFSTGPLGSGQAYFVKGSATEICPKIMEAKSISGYASNYCDNYQPQDERECKSIKVFTITEYQSE